MGRILALDYGARRTGIAVTDPSRIIAGGLTTVKSAELIPYLASYFASEEVDLVIIGRPTQMSGALSQSSQYSTLYETICPAVPPRAGAELR